MRKYRKINTFPDDRIDNLFRKTLYEQPTNEEDNVVKDKEFDSCLPVMVEMIEKTTSKLNEVIEQLYYMDVPSPIVVSNLLQQAMRIVYKKFRGCYDWEDFIREIFELHIKQITEEG